MNKIVISIGSNGRCRESNVEQCLEFLRLRFSEARFSTVYNTPASNGRDADYLNVVMEGTCSDDFDKTKSLLKLYETTHGRTPACKLAGLVPIDLDIVMWNGEVVRQRDLNQDYFQMGWKQLHK